MSFRDTVKRAALRAAKHALPELPEGLVRWQDEPQRQADARHPSVVLSTVSLVGNGNISVHESLTNNNTELTREMAQRWFWVVQVKVEGWKLDAKSNINPTLFTNKMRFGWRTLAVQREMDDLPRNRPIEVRFPIKMVGEPSEIRDVTSAVAGHRLPQYMYEIEFSYVEYDVDSEKETTLLGADIEGEFSDRDTLIPVTITV